MAKGYTQDQYKEIRKLVRAANRRIERATPGQRNYLEQYVRRITGGDSKFSSAVKGFSYQRAASLIEQISGFMEHETTFRRGWEAIKNKGVVTANKTWTKRGYDLTDQELADILTQIDVGKKDKSSYYRAVNLVFAKKDKMGKKWKGTPEQINEAISQKISEQDALQMALEIQEARKK